MSKYVVTVDKNLSELYHAGIKGMKWGRRRFQNEDGSLTEAGRKRYGVGDGDSDSKKSSSTHGVDDPYKRLDRAKRMQDSVMRDIDEHTGPDGIVRLRPHEDRAIRREWDKAVNEEAAAREQIKKTESSIKKIDEEMGNTPEAAKAYQENLRKSHGSDDGEKGLVPYGTKDVASKDDGEKGIVPVKGVETKSFKPGDDGYEIQDAPKAKSDDGDTPKSSERPKDFYTDDFEDKTDSGKSKNDKGPEIDDDVLSDVAKKAHANDAAKKRADAENLVGKALEERQKKIDAEKREREAEKNKREEEAEKKKNADEREKNKKEREKEEEEAHKRGEERKKEAEKNKREEERKQDLKELGAAKTIAKESGNIANELGNIAGRQRINVPRMDLKHLTNKQMQDEIQREIIEKQYDSMFNTSRHRAEARKERTQDFMKNVGSALTVTASALSIALAIKQLKG